MSTERELHGGRIRSVLGKRDDPYAGADLDNARRIIGLLGLLSTLLVVAYLPLDPPVKAIGAIGWALAAVAVVLGLGMPVAMLKHRYRPGFDALLVYAYFGLGQVALLEWLAGGAGSAYQELFLFWAVAGAGLHPPRRALPFLVVAPLVAGLPLLYEGWSGGLATDIAASAMMWSVGAVVVMALMTYVRGQRVRFAEEQRQAEGLARADELTGLGNRRALQEVLDSEIARARRAGSPLSFAILDLDHFKQVNDEHGHLEGDECLRQVAAALGHSMRASDRCFRWGGDEFAVVLPDTGYDEGQRVVQRIAATVRASCLRPDGLAQSLSWGVAELDGSHTLEELVGCADLALMARKGANGVERA